MIRATMMQAVSEREKGITLGRKIQKKYSCNRMGVPRKIHT